MTRSRTLVTLGLIALLGALLLTPTGSAQAGLVTFETVGCAGFEACPPPAAFTAALGSSTFLSFSTDKNGNPITAVNDPVLGTTYSNVVTFSTAASGFGPASPFIQHGNAATINSEIGPTPGFNGILRIDFAGSVLGVGFGTVALTAAGEIRVYDENLVLLQSFDDPSDNGFDYFGVIANGGDRIGRIELEGEFFAIQDILFSEVTVEPPSVPLPASVVLLGTGLLGLGGLGWWRRRA